MKLFSNLFFLCFFALAYCAAVPTLEEEFEIVKREAMDANADARFFPSVLPDGRKSIAVYNGDVLEGTIVDGGNGQTIAYDAYGNVVDLDDESEDGGEDNDLQKRSKWRILVKFGKILKKHPRILVSNATRLDMWCSD
jgi:hypothetical protein